MDREFRKEQLTAWVKKYRYVLIVLMAGIFLMVFPSKEENTPTTDSVMIEKEPNLQEALSSILSKVSGAGRVEVLLTQACGEETIYQTDENRSANDVRIETVVITNGNREEMGLIKQINPPVYLGAVVLCQGADHASVRLAIVEAVMSVTGLTSDCITVLKMK